MSRWRREAQILEIQNPRLGRTDIGSDCIDSDSEGVHMSRGYAAVGLHAPKTQANVGSALRACHVYGAGMMVSSGLRYQHHSADTKKTYRHIPFYEGVDSLRDYVPFDCVPVAVDLIEGAKSLVEYKHPERAFYVFGPEDGTLGQRTLEWCRDVVYVPTNTCMNLAATVNVVLYDRMAKQSLKGVK